MISFFRDTIICEFIEDIKGYYKFTYLIENEKVSGNWEDEIQYQNRAFFQDYALNIVKPNFVLFGSEKPMNNSKNLMNEVNVNGTLQFQVECLPYGNKSYGKFETSRKGTTIFQNKTRNFNTSAFYILSQSSLKAELLTGYQKRRIAKRFDLYSVN